LTAVCQWPGRPVDEVELAAAYAVNWTGLAGMTVNGSTARCRQVDGFLRQPFGVNPCGFNPCFQQLSESLMKSDEKIINILNALLAGELSAVDQYLIHGEMYADRGFTRLAEKALHESEHERQHALAIIQRILFLEGTPDMSKRSVLKIGRTVPEMLQSDLDYEYHVVGELKKAMAACEKAQDYVTRDMLAVQLEDTEMDHAYYLEKQLRLIELVGLKNYQQSQIDSGNPA
jgi:bacterioferritin